VLASLFPDFWGVELIRMARRMNEYMQHHLVEAEKAASIEGFGLRAQGS